jgi:hypothetical protein
LHGHTYDKHACEQHLHRTGVPEAGRPANQRQCERSSGLFGSVFEKRCAQLIPTFLKDLLKSRGAAGFLGFWQLTNESLELLPHLNVASTAAMKNGYHIQIQRLRHFH